MNSPHWKRLKSPRVGLASKWSERHAAYACGLGAFGLSDGLITAKGKAIRVGSVVTDLLLRPSEKVYPHSQANCLYYFNSTCKACATRCPAGAITAKGHDKDKCQEYAYGVAFRDRKQEYGVKITPGHYSHRSFSRSSAISTSDLCFSDRQMTVSSMGGYFCVRSGWIASAKSAIVSGP